MALTFDGGPTDLTSGLLDLLRSRGAKATFFVSVLDEQGNAIDLTGERFNLVKRYVAEGHQVALHTYNQVNMNDISSELRQTEILKNERAIANVIGI